MTTAAAGRSLLVAALLTACAFPPVSEVRLPPVTGSFDYQLGGVDDTAGLAVVARDASAVPMPGAYNLCYVNGFQSQPGEGERWLRDYGPAVLRDAAGAPVSDPDWPDEYVLDPSAAAQRKIILDVLGPLLSDCAGKGFDAVEIDNFDTFTRFSDPATGRIDEQGAIELARSYATIAHDHGLAIGQRNAAESVETGRREVGFDFAVAEECAAYRECARYEQVYGPHVLQIEYADNLPAPFRAVCDSPERAPLTILRDRDLVAAGIAGHVYEQCR
ncbi:MAG: hypothetical protein QOH82_3310 [Mycobacterium sp.]|nr:hypothetical protein [Mycobacterium sp.]